MEKQSCNLVVIFGLFISSSAWATEPKSVTFPNATPKNPIEIVAFKYKPVGSGSFPAVVLMHGCHGVTPTIHRWARWLQVRGYVALVVDSWKPRGISNGCNPDSPEIKNTERYNDAVGALRYLHGHPDIDRDRIGVMGWSNGGVFSMALVNGPSVERAIKREVPMPAPGFRASVGIYPGGCFSLLEEKFVHPVLLLLGAADDWTLPSTCIEMAQNMRKRGSNITLVTYPGAYHYFDVEGQQKTVLPEVSNMNRPGGCCGATVAYDAFAAQDALVQVEAFFKQYLMTNEQ